MAQDDDQKLTFIDLFAGIGGIRLGFEQAGFNCVYTNEVDSSAVATYRRNHGNEIDTRDIRQVKASEIPSHDILCAGFPCQPFSRAGVSARSGLGRKHGFQDEKQGNLFYEIVRIAKYHKPKVIFLENVANFERHDGGRSLAIVKDELTKLGYSFNSQVFDASLMVPHRRKRIFMVAMRDDIVFKFPMVKQRKHRLKDILEDKPDEQYTISDRLWESHKARSERNRLKGNGFRHHIVDINGIASTLTSRYGKDGRENLIEQKGKNPRMLTPRECARLMGFPETFILPDTKTPAYRQFGNSVCVPLVNEMAKALMTQIPRVPTISEEESFSHFAPRVIPENSPVLG